MIHISKPIASEMKRLKAVKKLYNGYYIMTYKLLGNTHNKRYSNFKELVKDVCLLRKRYKLNVDIKQFDIID